MNEVNDMIESHIKQIQALEFERNILENKAESTKERVRILCTYRRDINVYYNDIERLRLEL